MKKQGRVILTDRDKLMLEMICQFGYLKVSHIEKLIYKASKKVTWRRLSRLEDAGYLKHVSRVENSSITKTYIPNYAKLIGVVPNDVLERSYKAVLSRPWFRTTNGHEDCVRNWAIRLQYIFRDAWVDLDFMQACSPNSLVKFKKGGNGIFPDIILRISAKLEVAFEIELSHKNDERYLKKFLDIISVPNRPTIYLVENQSVYKTVLKNLTQVLENARRRNQPVLSSIQIKFFDDLKKDEDLVSLINEILGIRVLGAEIEQSTPFASEGIFKTGT